MDTGWMRGYGFGEAVGWKWIWDIGYRMGIGYGMCGYGCGIALGWGMGLDKGWDIDMGWIRRWDRFGMRYGFEMDLGWLWDG